MLWCPERDYSSWYLPTCAPSSCADCRPQTGAWLSAQVCSKHFGPALNARQSGGQCYLTSDRPQQCIYRASSPSFPIPWSVVVNGMMGSAMNEPFWTSTCYIWNGWSRTAVDNLCVGSLLPWTRVDCNGFGACDAGTIGRRHPP